MLPSIRFLVIFHVLLVGFLCFAASNFSLGCMKGERQALLKFKEGLKDPSSRLSSWVGEDCCTWVGVRCNNKTGHVVKLNLQNQYHLPSSIKRRAQLLVTGDYYAYAMRSCLSGEINPSLPELKYLNHLNLSLNCFGGISIPKFIGSFNKLRYLDLSSAGFAGRVPSELGNLSALHHLNLNNEVNYFGMPYDDLHVDRLDWLSRLSSLRHLDMGQVNLSMAADWLLSINMLPSLQTLTLSNCSLGANPTSLAYVNFSMLSSIDLSYNMFGPAIPTWLFNLSKIEYLGLGSNNFKHSTATSLGNLCNLRTLRLRSNSLGGDMSRFKEGFSGCLNKSLEELDLSSNGLDGNLPDWLWRFSNLKTLVLSRNSLSGPIPASLGGMSFLRELYLYDNKLNGTIPESLGKLSNLESLDVSNNSVNGILSEAHFFNSKRLMSVDLSSNSLLVLKVSSNWVPPFQLQDFFADGCKLGPKFPSWLQTQNQLVWLSLSNTAISGNIPDFFWNFSSNIAFIDLSDNLISGSIAKSIGKTTTNLIYLSLSSNRFTGNIPLSICKIPLTTLDLSYNQLTNEVPSCIGDLQYLRALVLRNNNLSGDIPTSIGHLSWLQSLHLSLNKLSGELPPSLKSCKKLITLDLEKNGLTGKIPTWIGERMSLLQHLIMRSNKFEGSIPLQLSLLSKLRVLDLADNDLSGIIPPSFSNFSAMAVANKKNEFILPGLLGDLESIWVFWKGKRYEYNNTLSLMMAIDLSSNNLSGEIPEDITLLFGLRNLNLSKNNFIGLIPKTIGQLRWVESLDLSFNQFTGVIPPTFSALTSLSYLNLSHNNLSGRIPSGNQLNTLTDPSIYKENPLLCGPPLSKQCPGDETSQDDLQQSVIGDGEDRNWSEMQLFYLSMGGGFVVGFWIVWCILLFKRSWRIAYFCFFDDMRDKLYVAIARKKCPALRMEMCIGTH